jgi:hypothetical protein
MPDRNNFTLTAQETLSFNVTTFGHRLYGVLSPGLLIPKYWNELFGIYKYAYIHAAHFKFDLGNIGAGPISVVLAEGNTVDSVSATMPELAQTPRNQFTQLIPAGNHSVVTFNKTAVAKNMVGHKVEDSSGFWITGGAPPTAPVLPVLALGWESTVFAGSSTLTITVTVKYDISYFSLNPQ